MRSVTNFPSTSAWTPSNRLPVAIGTFAPETQGVVLIHPGVIARLDAHLRHVHEAGSRQAMEAPAFGTVIARRCRPVERTLAFAPIELAQMSACQGHPHHAVAVDVRAAHAEPGRGHIVDLAQARSRIESNDGAGIAKCHRAPDAAVGGIRHDRVDADRQTPVARRVGRLAGLDPGSSLPLPLVSSTKGAQP
jgi:hypothetical protein